MHDTLVIGGGVIGLAIARDLASTGRSILVLERGLPGQGTSWAAAGMLAPQSEAKQPGPFFDLGMASLRGYRDWAGSLCEETSIDPEYAVSGVLRLAPSSAEMAVLERTAGWQRESGLAVESLSPDDVLKLEPRMAMPIAGALWYADAAQVTPRRLTQALAASCAARGVEIRPNQGVEAILCDGARVAGVRIGQTQVSAGEAIVASGVWSPEIAGLAPPIPVYPRRGQILALAQPTAIVTRPVLWGNAYAVPRRNGQLIIGATNEDAGFDRSLTPAGIGGLLAEAQRLSPAVASCPIHEMWTGLRPATPDDLPIIGRAAIDGLFYATGHYRNGILLAPITAACMTALVENRATPVALDAFSPLRFQVP